LAPQVGLEPAVKPEINKMLEDGWLAEREIELSLEKNWLLRSDSNLQPSG